MHSQSLKYYGLILFTVFSFTASAQNSMVGDGFGGRLWYKPQNYTVGSYSAYTVCGDSHQLYGWGANHSGQLGDGTNNSTTSPVKALGMTNVKFYSTGYNMGAIKWDSTAWVWGNPLGSTPTKVLDSVKFLDAAINMVSFVKYDGTVWTVGNNGSGAFGNDSIKNATIRKPVKMKKVNKAVRVALTFHTITILLSDKTVMTTGNNSNGCLGNTSNVSAVSKLPQAVPGLKGIVDIKSVTYATIALDSLGDVYAWGNSDFCGNGNSGTQFYPAKINGLKKIVAISGSADGYHFMAIDENHNCYTWGRNIWGNMGIGIVTASPTPALISTDVSEIMAGETFSYLMKDDGTLWATGQSLGGSIYMNLKDSARDYFTKIDPTIAPLNLCELNSFEGNFFNMANSLCVYDSIIFKAYKNDSFNNQTWDFGDNGAAAYGTKVKHKFDTVGTYAVRLVAQQKRTMRYDTVIRIITIHKPVVKRILGQDTTVCGKLFYLKTPTFYDDEYSYEWNSGETNFSKYIAFGGAHSLKITDEHGCYYYDTFRVTQHPLPKALFKADKYTMCQNDKGGIKFTNLSTSSDSIAKVVWDFTEKVVVSSDSVQYYKFKNADAIPVFLSVYTKHGCRSDTIDVVYIKPAPHPNFTLNILDSCFNNNSITLKNTSVVDSLEMPRFKWYFSEGYVLSNSNPKARRSYVDTGKYYIDLIYAYANKCIDTFRKDLTIYTHPKSNFIFNGPFCKGSAAQFFDSSSADYRPLKYQWQFGDLGTASDSAPQHIYNKKGYYKVSLKSISPQGCSDSASKIVNVYNPPTANFTINDSIQCLVSNQFQFKSTASADSSQLSLLNWRFGDNTSDTGRSPANKVYASAQTFTITHMVSDARGCKDSVSKTVLVQNGPISDFRINNTSQCENLQNFQFTYVPKVGNDSIIELQWTINGNTYLNQANVNLTNLPLGKTAIDLILKTTEGCPGLTTKHVVVNPKPKANFTINAAVQCFDGHAFDFTNTSSISSGSIIAHQWLLGDNTNYLGLNPATKTYNAATTYQIQLAIRSDSACVDTLAQSITINPNPIVDIDLVQAVCLNNPSVFKNKSSISSGSIVAYDWDFGDLNNSTVINPSHTYANADIYNIGLKATSDKGCTSANVFANHVTVFALPIAKFSYAVAEGEKDDHLFQFKNNSSPSGLNSRWNFGKFGTARMDTSISIIDTASISVQLIVKDNNGCADTIQQLVLAYGPLRVFFPTAFTPNDNGLNETFAPGGVLAYQSYNFSIYNRWGEKVFESDAVTKAWDGTYQNSPCMDGVYVYVLKLVDANGRLKIYRGALTLLK